MHLHEAWTCLKALSRRLLSYARSDATIEDKRVMNGSLQTFHLFIAFIPAQFPYCEILRDRTLPHTGSQSNDSCGARFRPVHRSRPCR
jgi:hypothetical protein